MGKRKIFMIPPDNSSWEPPEKIIEWGKECEIENDNYFDDVFKKLKLLIYDKNSTPDEFKLSFLNLKDEIIYDKSNDIIFFDINSIDSNGYTILFYAVENLRKDIIKLLVDELNANINYITEKGEHVLHKCILNNNLNSSDLLRYLIKLGAYPMIFPKKIIWDDEMIVPDFNLEKKNLIVNYGDIKNAIKYSELIEKELISNMNFTKKYWIRRGHLIPFQTIQSFELLKKSNLKNIARTYMSIIGQNMAIEKVILQTISHFCTGLFKTPLIFVFAGHPGHGKTYFAENFAKELGFSYIKILCSTISSIHGLFGATPSYRGSEYGSQLNNFLSNYNNNNNIVILDEFDKMDNEIIKGFLEIFETGTYIDSRYGVKEIDCKKTIWILTLNCADDEILSFVKKNKYLTYPTIYHIGKKLNNLYHNLTKIVRQNLQNNFGQALTSRLRNIIPFLPFIEEDIFVISENSLNNFVLCLKEPIDIKKRKFLPPINIIIKDHDNKLLKYISSNYNIPAGARSIEPVICELSNDIVKSYLVGDINENISAIMEMNNEGEIQIYYKNI